MPIPAVSVIITTFNRPQELREAVQSVLDQDFSDLELVVVDDASPGEATAQTVGSFSDARIHYIKNEKNLGGAMSLNVGLKAATGKYVAILDDDDIWVDRVKTSKQVKFLEEHTDHVLVGTNAVIVESKSKKELLRSNWPPDDTTIRSIIFHANPFAHSSVIYLRESALSVGGYDEKLPRGKDYDLMLALGTRGKMAVLPDYSLMYRETMPETKDLIARRLKDAKATATVLWKHKGEYPNFWRAYARVEARVFIFKCLNLTPFLYGFFKKA